MSDDTEVVEALAVLTGEIKGINRRLDTMNGSVASAMRWQNAHDVVHAKADGYRDGVNDNKAEIALREKVLFGAFVTGVIIAAQVIGPLLKTQFFGG